MVAARAATSFSSASRAATLARMPVLCPSRSPVVSFCLRRWGCFLCSVHVIEVFVSLVGSVQLIVCAWAQNVFGLLHALETFSQLCNWTTFGSLDIIAMPRFPYGGLLIEGPKTNVGFLANESMQYMELTCNRIPWDYNYEKVQSAKEEIQSTRNGNQSLWRHIEKKKTRPSTT